MTGNPADQPDVEFVVTADAGEPAPRLRYAARGQQVVAASAEHVVGGLVGGAQEGGHPKPGGTRGRGPHGPWAQRNGGDNRRRRAQRHWGVLQGERMGASGGVLRPTTLAKPEAL